ncbi:MAG: hypothetical protein K2L07_06985 [Lachnospiraceae bacterium]|nr:hypothetical protein [Lachnospiraceae bacterium]
MDNLNYNEKVNLREMNLGAMLIEVMRKWRIVLVCMIFMGLLFLIAGLLMSETGKNQKVEYELTDDDKRNIEKFRELNRDIETLREYMNESINMRMNPYNENAVTLEYLIMAEPEDVKSVYFSYMNYVEYGDIAKEIASELGVKESYVSEVLSMIDLQNDKYEDKVNNVIIIQVLHYDREACEKMADIVQEKISNHNDIKKIGLEYELKLVSRESSYVSNAELQKRRDEINKNIKDKEIDMKDLLANISPAVRAETIEEDEEKEEEVSSKRNVLFYAIFGLILGFMIAVIYIDVKYILNNKVKSIKELSDIYNKKVLGIIVQNNRRNIFIDRWLDKIFLDEMYQLNEEDRQGLLVNNIVLTCRKKGISKIVLSINNNFPSEYLNELKQKLKSYHIEISEGGSLLYNIDTINKANDIGTVILSEEIRQDSYEKIVKELQICDEYGIEVLGFLAL